MPDNAELVLDLMQRGWIQFDCDLGVWTYTGEDAKVWIRGKWPQLVERLQQMNLWDAPVEV